MTGLHIAPGLVLPEDAVTETFAILAKRGKGKTNTAVVMAEEMIRANLPVVVIDPVGVWWGLRSSADGTSAGLPVVIFGGDHADVPLEETAGKVLADVVVDERIPIVVDTSSLSKSATRRFMADFLERLYHRNRDPLHVIIDEADAFAPQRAAAEGARLLGAMEDLVRRGRARGLGVTLITQRPAVLHKDVLTQAEVLVALGMTGPRDVAAIDEWVRLHADEDKARELKASLPSLPVGTAWWWSPGWLEILVKVQVRARTTFDSSATPKAGQRRPAPKRMAEIDLAALGEKITATVERAKAEDPRALRRRIAELEKAAANLPAAERVEVPVPVLSDEQYEGLVAAVEQLQEVGEQVLSAWSEASRALAAIKLPAGAKEGSASQGRRSAPVSSVPPAARLAAGTPTSQERPPAVARDTRPAPAGGTLPKAQRAVLTVLAQHGPRTKVQVAVLAGYAHNGGGFNNALGALRSAGHITGRDVLEATTDGLDALGPVDPLPNGAALVEHWQSRLGRAERLILQHLVEVWPEAVTKDDLAAATEYAANGGGFNNALGRLRGLELIEGRGELRAADVLGGAS